VPAAKQPVGQNFAFPEGQITFRSPHPVLEEGALAIVTERWDGMWWTRRHRARDGIAGRDKLRERSQDVLTSGAEAYGKTVWTRCLNGRHQVFRRCESPTGPQCRFPGGDGGEKSPILRGERDISRKAIAQGMSDVLRCPVCSCAFSLPNLHTGPRVQRASGIPCSLNLGDNDTQSSDRSCRENADAYPLFEIEPNCHCRWKA
jgi:hypothetical protein